MNHAPPPPRFPRPTLREAADYRETFRSFFETVSVPQRHGLMVAPPPNGPARGTLAIHPPPRRTAMHPITEGGGGWSRVVAGISVDVAEWFLKVGKGALDPRSGRGGVEGRGQWVRKLLTPPNGGRGRRRAVGSAPAAARRPPGVRVVRDPRARRELPPGYRLPNLRSPQRF